MSSFDFDKGYVTIKNKRTSAGCTGGGGGQSGKKKIQEPEALCSEGLRSLTHGNEDDGDDNYDSDNYCGGGDVGNGRCSCGSSGCDGGDDGSGCSSGGGRGC